MPRIKRTKTAAENPARSSELIETQAAESGRLVKKPSNFSPGKRQGYFRRVVCFFPEVKHTQ